MWSELGDNLVEFHDLTKLSYLEFIFELVHLRFKGYYAASQVVDDSL